MPNLVFQFDSIDVCLLCDLVLCLYIHIIHILFIYMCIYPYGYMFIYIHILQMSKSFLGSCFTWAKGVGLSWSYHFASSNCLLKYKLIHVIGWFSKLWVFVRDCLWFMVTSCTCWPFLYIYLFRFSLYVIWVVKLVTLLKMTLFCA